MCSLVQRQECRLRYILPSYISKMETMTDDELLEEIARRKDALSKKRQLDEISQMSEKRLKLMKELEEINLAMEESNLPFSSSESSSASSSSSSSSSASSSASSTFVRPADPPDAILSKPKNSMLSYWVAKDNNAEVIDVEAIDARRVADAKSNSESRQSDKDRQRVVVPVGRKLKEGRPCSSFTYSNLKRKLKGIDMDIIQYNAPEKKIWCSACPCFVRDDNLFDHIATEKHQQASKLAIESNLHQASLETAISIAKNLSQNLVGQTHLFRCELVRTLLTSAIAINKADDWRPFLEKWCKVECTDSSNLLRTYLPIIKVLHY